MADYSLVEVDHQPDFDDVSLVPVDHDPFSADANEATDIARGDATGGLKPAPSVGLADSQQSADLPIRLAAADRPDPTQSGKALIEGSGGGGPGGGFGGSTSGGRNPFVPDTAKLPTLQRLHPDETTVMGNKSGYDYWSSKSTQEIINSLQAGNKMGPLTAKPDGTVVQGNTRIYILQQRGVDVNSLPREPYP